MDRPGNTHLPTFHPEGAEEAQVAPTKRCGRPQGSHGLVRGQGSHGLLSTPFDALRLGEGLGCHDSAEEGLADLSKGFESISSRRET